MKDSEIIFRTIFLVASFLILTDQCHGNQLGICFMNKRPVCCSAFEFNNGTCKQCSKGYTSPLNSTCKPCTNDMHGYKCKDTCTCTSNEKCDHIKGCILDDRRTRGNNNASRGNSEDLSTTSNGGDVVIFMTCVAVGSVLVVVCGLIVKNREAICRHKSGNNSVKHLIHKLKQPSSHNGHSKKVEESLYDEINEKYMINFDGE